jgi:hypothetical protein
MTGHKFNLNVLVLGAGASASCGIALTKDILRESMEKLSAEEPDKARKANRLLEYLYQDFNPGYRNYPNIEDFLNILEIASTFNSQEFIESTLWPKTKTTEVKKIVLRALTEYLWKFMSGNKRSHYIDTYFGNHVPTETVIITFNWDLSVEQSLSKRLDPPPIGYQYSESDSRKDAITLLKPHGSLNWFRKRDIDRMPNLRARRLDGDIFICKFIDVLLSHDLAEFTPIIVPPVFNKDFSSSTEDFNSKVFSRTWTSIYKSLRRATRLTILGYSLPKEDQFAKFVFRRALRNNLLAVERKKKPQLEMHVVNPDETTEGTFARLVGRDGVSFKFHRSKFEDYVDSLS